MNKVLDLEALISGHYKGQALEEEYKQRVLGLKKRYTYIKHMNTFTHSSLLENTKDSYGEGIARVGFFNIRNKSETSHKVPYSFRKDSQGKPRAYVLVSSIDKYLPLEAIEKLKIKGLDNLRYIPLYSLVMCLASDNYDSVKGLHCHHWMNDPWNNDIRTLEYLTPEQHRAVHSTKGTYLYDPEFHSFTVVKGYDAREIICSEINLRKWAGEKVLFIKIVKVEEKGVIVEKFYICSDKAIYIINPNSEEELSKLPFNIYNECLEVIYRRKLSRGLKYQLV